MKYKFVFSIFFTFLAGTNITVDLATVFSGDSVFTLTATDTENDALTYFCNVTDTLVPLECATGIVCMKLQSRLSVSY